MPQVFRCLLAHRGSTYGSDPARRSLSLAHSCAADSIADNVAYAGVGGRTGRLL